MGFVLKVDGVSWPCPAVNGFKITREKIWSSNTRRSSSAKMQGKIKAIKRTLDIAFPHGIDKSEITKINDAVNSKNPWHTIEFTNEKGNTESGTFYFGSPSYEPYSFIDGKMVLSSLSIQAVER